MVKEGICMNDEVSLMILFFLLNLIYGVKVRSLNFIPSTIAHD